MRGSASQHTRRRGAALSLVMLMLFSSLLAFVPATSASGVTGNLALVEGLEPMPDATYDRDTAFIVPKAIVYNDQTSTHASREIRWQICAGDYVAVLGCPGNPANGLTSTGSVSGHQNVTVTFSSGYQPFVAGIHTVVFFFSLTDNNATDDKLAYTFNVSAPLRDISVNHVNFDESQVYNSNSSYPISADLYRRSWGMGDNATFGWRLYDNGSEIASESNETIPPVATDQHWVHSLPDFVAPYPGIFVLEVGLLSSPWDMNEWNNLVSFPLEVNDDLDVWVETIEPARGSGETIEVQGQNNTLYPYGINSIRVKVGNIGHVLVNSTVLLTIFDLNGTLLDGPTECNVTMTPGEPVICIYEMPVTGEFILNASFPFDLESLDINPSDNWFEVEISSRFISANPVVSNPTEGERFDSGDEILFIGQVSQMSAMPLNFTWRLNYEELIGYGQIFTTTLPMGEWLVTLTTRDANGQLQTGVRTIRIQNRISLTSLPWLVGGESVMDVEIDYQFNEPAYPPEGFQYEAILSEGLSPLRIIDYDLEPSDPGVTDPGIVFTQSWIDLSVLLPTGLDRSSIRVYRMDSLESALVEEIEYPSAVIINTENDTMLLYDEEFTNGLYLIAGDLQPANVSAINFHSEQGEGGEMTLVWSPEGDLDNPYFGGWRIYRRISFPFFWPYETESQFWSVAGTEVGDLAPHSSSWVDPTPLQDGTCASYLIIALDRQSNPDHTHGAAAGFDGIDVEWQCGDATPPHIEVEDLDYNLTFDNSSGQNIHHLNVTWTWPDYGVEENVTWILYRVEVVPSSLTWMEPIATGLSGETGEEARFHEWEGPAQHRLKVERTYNYILLPVDSVGNVDYAPLENNIITLTIENQFWDYNSHLIPVPPPEAPPPYGIPWLRTLYDYLDIGAFTMTAMMAFSVLLLNVVMIPVIINQTRGVRRRIKRAKWESKAEREAMMADEMGDELEDLFY